MYLDELLNDTFFLLLLVVLSALFVYVGWKNHKNPESQKPSSPLGRYLLRIAIAREDVARDPARKAAVTKKIVRLDAKFALLTGFTMILVMIIVVVIVLIS